ncbi:AAA family ATPase [Candidatus Woesearchaeota archaeon]|nr:AAA family ATPase [Candidatus Woesearchaeota archaeon]
MIIKKIKLENIRSYVNQEVSFPAGNILLSGNIGSGKTTLLLAIDFVLFGLRKGELSGGALLRHGESKGSVELEFEIDNKKIILKRTLKREKNSIAQSAGFISINGEVFEGTAVELKQRVLELFNYPMDSLTKSKSLVYNYTVYTPQEEMKSILLNESSERLTILRKVFGIDKYQRILDNSKFLTSAIKNKKKEFEIKTSSLPDKINERDEKRARVTIIKQEIEELDFKIKQFNEEIFKLNNELKEIEEKKIKRDKLEREFSLIENNIENLLSQRTRNNKEINNLQEEINLIEEELKGKDQINVQEINNKILEINEKVRENESKLKELSKRIHECNLKIDEANKSKKEIQKLEHCPYCRQNVSDVHKCNITDVEDRKIKENQEIFYELNGKEVEIENAIKDFRIELDSLNKQKSYFELYKFKQDSLQKKYNKLNELNEEQNKYKIKIGELNVKKSEVNKELELIPDFGEKYSNIKSEIDKLLYNEKKLFSERASDDKEMNLFNETIKRLDKEIENSELIKKKIVEYSKLITWFENEFSNLIQLMEKQIMLKVHSDFDSLFKEWFMILVSDDNLKIKLDYDFTPLIQQNGYDTDYLHLSGGERTAAALAYRLALNQVINTVMSDINTKDILILDEPTDGFSEEQVDKIRLILEQLGVKQVIIVSHDPKIESFVDKVIRFEKVDGISRVL